MLTQSFQSCDVSEITKWGSFFFMLTCICFYAPDTYSLLHHNYPLSLCCLGAWLKVLSGLQASGSKFCQILETSIPNFLCLTYSRNRSAFKYKWQDNRTLVFVVVNIIFSFCTVELKMPHFMLMVCTFRVFHPLTAKTYY